MHHASASAHELGFVAVCCCRSLPYEALLAELSQAVGSPVVQGNLRYSLTQAFGEDASLKAQAYIGVSEFSCI